MAKTFPPRNSAATRSEPPADVRSDERLPTEVEAQILECATKPRVAPRRILARHRQQQRDLIASGGWPAPAPAGTTPVVLRRDLLAVPPEDGLWRRERRHLGQKASAEGPALLGEQPSLGIGEAKTLLPEPGPQHAVLGAQVVDRLALPATDPAGDQQNEELKRSDGCHGRRTIASANRRASHGRESRAIDFWDTTGSRVTDAR